MFHWLSSTLTRLWQWLLTPGGVRDTVVGGLILAILLGLAAAFRKWIVEAYRRLAKKPSPDPQPSPSAPQQVVLRVETAQPLPPPAPPAGQTPVPASVPSPGPVWNVPIPRNPLFTGREQVLNDVAAALRATHAAALSGLGGVGKTQTAAEYAHRHRDKYKAVLWASAASRESLVADFVAIAGLLGLPESNAKEQSATIAAVKRWMQANAGWLLILDNADELPLAREFLPLSGEGRLLLTTRAQTTAPLAECIEIGDMQPEEAALFLLRRAGIIAAGKRLDAATPADRQLAEQISNELGGLALALDQAGAFIAETPSTLAEYIAFYNSEGKKLRDERGQLGHHPSVTVTFSLAFKKVAEHAAAGDLVRLCAFLTPDAIPEEIFTQGAAELGESLAAAAANGLAFVQALNEAGRFSLVGRNPRNKTLDIHRLVQAVVRDGMGTAEERLWAERAVRAVNRAFPVPEFANWNQCERLLPHAFACAALIEKFSFEFEAAARLLNQTGYYLGERARYSYAEPLYKRALDIREKTLGPDHPDVAASLNNLASLYHNQGKYAQAEPLFQRALAISEKALGPDHPDVATSLNNLAYLYHCQGKYAQAEPLYQRALDIDEKALGPDHPGLATDLNNLASLYDSQGKYAQAEPLYQRALAIDEKALGPDHPGLATDLNNLASLYHKQGKYAQAEPLYQRALAIREKALGPEHPNVAQSLNNLAALYDSQGKYAQAEPLHKRALAIDEKALGPDHPNVATVLKNYAALLRATHREAEAQKLEARAQAIRARHAQAQTGNSKIEIRE